MLRSDRIHTPDEWLYLAKLLSSAITDAGMTDRTDCLVKICDGEGSESMPIAWHIPATSDIVLNAHKIADMRILLALPRAELEELVRDEIGCVRPSYRASMIAGGGLQRRILEQPVWQNVKAAVRIRGVLAHEAAHSKWSHYIMEDWWKTCDRNEAAVITQLDEVRIEAMQVDENDSYRAALRTSSQMLLPTREEIEGLADLDGRVHVPSLALNFVLSLGRADLGLLHEYEVREIRHLAEDIIGFDRVQSMREIWVEFAEIELGDEEEEMPALAAAWLDLFRTDSDDEDDEEMIDLGGLIDVLGGLISDAGAKAEKWSGNTDAHGTPEDCKDAKTEAESVFGEKSSSSDSFRRRRPKPRERSAASRMAKELEKLSVHARSVTSIRSLTPPGRLHSRSAVAAAADRAQGRATTAQPWERKIKKYTETPKLTVGVMTDTSGSMSWASNFVASAAWIISRAVRHVNGDVAAVTFGDIAESTIGPKDSLEEVVIREADGGSEAFNSAAAALDGVLRLTDSSNGVRILFVISDGFLVAPGEMAAAAKWVERLTKSGCLVVWITDSDPAAKYSDLPAVPPQARVIRVSNDIEIDDAVSRMIAVITKEFKNRR